MHPKQQAILNFIRDYPHRYPPSVREIGAGVGINSSSTVHRHLTMLVNQGLIERKPNSPRCIELVEGCL
ncbi:LexA family protein [Pelosinus sp. sgz500959]|uniref:LexA family protein n=1 Tax=Pelosinus sp. sgz500959 TaxID=3242472 RepID=UPI003672B064